MLETVLMYLKNWFAYAAEAKTFVIEDGKLANDNLDLVYGQYYRIVGSIFNDGLHQFDVGEPLVDESFDGTVYALAVPKAVIEIADEIADWVEKHPTSDKQSESFGGYSYTRATVNGNMVDWATAFGTRLNAWRKV